MQHATTQSIDSVRQLYALQRMRFFGGIRIDEVYDCYFQVYFYHIELSTQCQLQSAAKRSFMNKFLSISPQGLSNAATICLDEERDGD
jgi:hypothetical protein